MAFETSFTSTLSKFLSASETGTFELADSPQTLTSGVLLFGEGDNREWISFNGIAANVYTIVARGLEPDATSVSDGGSTIDKFKAKDHLAGTTVKLVAHSLDLFDRDGNNTITGDNTWSGTQTLSSTTKAALILQNVTTAQRDALTGVVNGAHIYNTTTNQVEWYEGGAWVANAAGGSVADSSETVAGKVELATNAEMGTATSTGGSGARLTVPNDQLVKTSSGAGDENKVPVLNASGQLATGFMSANLQEADTFFGATDITGAQAETLSDGSNADSLHTHTGLVDNAIAFAGDGYTDGTLTDSGDSVVVNLADAAAQTWHVSVPVPDGKTAISSITYSYRINGTSGNIVYSVDVIRHREGAARDADNDMPNTTEAITTSPTGGLGTITVPSSAYNALSSFSNDDYLTLQFTREGSDGSDTYSSSLGLTRVRVEFS